MPQVPKYDRETRLNGSPLPYEHYNLNEYMFGGAQAKATAKLGDDLNVLGKIAENVQNQFEDAQMLEFSNKISEWEETNLYNKDTGYFHKNGKEAVGQSTQVMKSYDDFVREYTSKNKLSPYNKRRMDGMITQKRTRISAGVSAHDIQETGNWAKTEGETGINNAIKGMINARNNPEEMKIQLATIENIIDWQGQMQRLDEDTVKALKENAVSQAHCSVLDTYIADDDLKAIDYLNQHEHEISSDKFAHYKSAVNNLKITYTARTTAQSLIGLPMEDAYSQINSIQNPKERHAVMQEYNLLTNQQEEIQRSKSNDIMSGLQSQIGDILAGGGNPSKLKLEILKSDLSWEAKKKQIDFINDCVSTNQEANLWSDKETLDELKCTDYETFRKIDLSQYALTKAEREEFLKAQREVKDYTSEKQLRDIVKKVDTSFNIGGGLSSDVYKNELIGLFARIERLQGKAFDLKSINEGSLKNFINGFNYKEKEMPEELKRLGIKDFKNVDETKELYMRAKQVADVQDKVARSYVQFKHDNGREPNQAEMYGIVQNVYTKVARENWQNSRNKVQSELQIQKNINSASIKKVGYTKVLTNFEERTIPSIERQTGIKIKITSTYRPTGKYGHERGMKADVFPANPTRTNIEKSAEALLASPDVAIVFTSNAFVLDKFRGHPKLKDATSYDKSPEAIKAGINHKTHFDITLSKRFGGTEQIIPTTISSKK